LEAGAATVKEMESGEQEDVPFDDLVEYLKEHVAAKR
jgi:histidyl-tRNA synthetase